MRARRTVGLVIALTLVLPGAVVSFAQQTANPAVDQIFADQTKPGSPGCALGVYRDGAVIYTKGYGLANIEANLSITPQSVFDIGSTSKQFTAASILLLAQRGKLSLNDDIRKYIPELRDYGYVITILHLLNHTSGVRDYLGLMNLAGVNIDGVTTDEDALGLIVRQKKLNFEPGSEWLYSNSGYFLLSVIVKRASGQTLREFARDSLFVPLRMTHTQYRDDHTSLIPNRALAYVPAGNPEGGYALDVSYFEQTGDGAVHTSVEDLLKWDENFYSGQIGGKEFLAEIQQPGKLASGKPLDYAKGLSLGEYRGLRTVSHGGAWGGYRAELLRFPEQHFSVACLCNLGTMNPSRKAQEVADVYLAGLMKPKEGTPSAGGQPADSLSKEELGAWAGTYRDVKKSAFWRVTLVGTRLRVNAAGRLFEVRALSATEFEPSNPGVKARLTFEPARTGTPRSLRVTGDPDFAANLETVDEPRYSAADLAAFAGDYWSDELGVTYRLEERGGKLVWQDIIGADGMVRTRRTPPREFHAFATNEFDISGTPFTLHFERGGDRKIAAFVLDAGRTQGMAFTRKNGGETK